MTAPAYRISELATWQRCRWQWQYAYQLRAARPQADSNYKAHYLAIGTAIHRGIEVGMLKAGSPVEAALQSLELQLGEGAARYAPGVERAIKSIPAVLWEKAVPQVEDEYAVLYHHEFNYDHIIAIIGGRASYKDVGWVARSEGKLEELRAIGDRDDIIIYGHPDIWWKDEDGITILDYKSSSETDYDKLHAYDIFNLQLDYYGVLLHDLLKLQGFTVPPIYKQHVLISTAGKDAIVGQPKLLDGFRDDRRQLMLGIASEITTLPLLPSPSTYCAMCEFRSIDEIRLTGGDWRGKIRAWSVWAEAFRLTKEQSGI